MTHLDWNLQRLDEVLKQGNTDYFKSAALQRFGHTYTMAIKSIRGFSEADLEATDEKCIELAMQKGWANDSWIEMIADYKCLHQKPVGQEEEIIYRKLPIYQQTLKSLFAQLQSLT